MSWGRTCELLGLWWLKCCTFHNEAHFTVLSLVFSISLVRMTHPNNHFLFCCCRRFFLNLLTLSLMTANSRQTLNGWMCFSLKPSWPISASSQTLSFCFSSAAVSASDVWSLKLQTLCWDSSNWSKDELSLCHQTREQLVSYEKSGKEQYSIKAA